MGCNLFFYKLANVVTFSSIQDELEENKVK